MKHELQNIISGKSQVKFGKTIQTAASYLASSQKSGDLAKEYKQFRKQETENLSTFITENNLWLLDINLENYVSEGAEQRVFLKDHKFVNKLNDAIFYESWVDYFHNLLLHNYFFSDTAYNLLGFYKDKGIVFAVVEQQFVIANEHTDLTQVKKFMLDNGFENNKNNDYINIELGIILEDLHDENVLTFDGNLFFIDTVFYLKNNFFV
jgi:Serine/Threonine/Tyrosine Kinase found in polyvalent proteins